MGDKNRGFNLSWRTAYDRLRRLLVIAKSALMLLGISTGHRKVFAIGFNKTATSSIHEVFQKLGMLSAHNTHWRDTKRTFVFLKYQCFTDGPPDDFTALDRRFKNSKFILNIRDLDEWIDSRLEHIRLSKEKKSTQIHSKWDRTDFAVKHWIEERNHYHQQVLDYFRDRPDDLLVLNYIREADPGQKIADFLGKTKIVSKVYKRSTQQTRERGTLRNKDRIHRCLTELAVPKSAWQSDIHCPTESNSTAYWPYDSAALNYPDIITQPDENSAP
ncbi:MAG: hypothetical protein GQ535_16400 [Rhodobacteraceae bacterium]|nr:hypothetical protein [Paracoccaceae bacterium]